MTRGQRIRLWVVRAITALLALSLGVGYSLHTDQPWYWHVCVVLSSAWLAWMAVLGVNARARG